MTLSKVIVCGGRDYNNRDAVYRALDGWADCRGIGLVIQGGARGADALAKQWAHYRQVPCLEHPARWNEGKHAGIERNEEMLEDWNPDYVLAFPGGRGTAHMIKIAREADVLVWEMDRATERWYPRS